MKSDLIDITVHLLHETDRAVLVTDSTPENGVWLPLSQIEIEARDGDLQRGCVAVLTAPEQVLMEKGLI